MMWLYLCRHMSLVRSDENFDLCCQVSLSWRGSLTNTDWLRSYRWGRLKKREMGKIKKERERKGGCVQSFREGINDAASLSWGPVLGHRWVLGHSSISSGTAQYYRITQLLRTFPVQWPSTGTDCTKRLECPSLEIL